MNELNALPGTTANEIEADGAATAVVILEEDFGALKDLQVSVDTLSKYRQEIGRLFQLISNLRDEANTTETKLAERRRDLASKYDLEKHGPAQWALDFEAKEFVKAAPGTPAIP